MRKLAFFSCCFCILVFFDAFEATRSLKLKLGIIIETCFNKTKEFEEKLSKVTAVNGSLSVAVFDAQCGNTVAAREQVCSLIKNDEINSFVALATNRLVGLYEMTFNALRSSRMINTDLKTFINDIADEFVWTNIFIYVDKIYGNMMPRCSQSCRSVMVWTTDAKPEDFIHQTLFYSDGRKIVRTETNYYVIILTAKLTKKVIEIAQENRLFNFYTEWLIFVGADSDEVMKSLRCLKYNSNVYIAQLRNKEVPVEEVLNLIAVRDAWENNYRSTNGRIQNNRIKYVCGDDNTDSEINTDIPRYTSEFKLSEVIPTRFDADPSLHLLGQWSMNGNPRYQNVSERKIPNFEGVNLKVATLQTPPYVIVEKYNSSTNFSGYLVDLLKIAAEKLNFTYDIFAVEDDEFGELECDNGTCRWSGIIGAVKRGEAQIALANLTPLPIRAKDVLFLHTALATGGFRMIYSKPNVYDESNVLRAYIRPFHYRTWICVVSIMLVLVFLLVVGQRIKYGQRTRNKWRNANKISKDFKIGNPIFVALQVLCQQGLQDTPKDGSSRILFIVMWLFSLLVYASYAATLTSFFTTSELKLPIRNLKDFLKQNEYKMAFKAGSAYVALMGEKYIQEEFHRLNERLLKDGEGSFVASITEGFERIKKEKLIFAHDQGTVKWYESRSCNLIAVGPVYLKIGVTIATNMDSEYYRGLDWVLRLSKEVGIARRIEKEHWGKKAVDCNLKNNKFESVSILTVCAPLLILGVGLCSGLLVVPLEGMYNWMLKGDCKSPTTNRKGHTVSVEALKKTFYAYRTFSQRKGLRKRIVSSRRSPGAVSFYF